MLAIGANDPSTILIFLFPTQGKYDIKFLDEPVSLSVANDQSKIEGFLPSMLIRLND